MDGNLGDKAKLQAITVLAILVAALTGYTALGRYQRLEKRREALEMMKLTPRPSAVPPVMDVEKAAKSENLQKLLPRNILFTFAHYRASAAYIAGDFNGWKPEPMKKEKTGIWRAAISIPPGVYKYNFIAGGTKHRDRYNKRRDGAASVLVVEALKR